MTTEYVNAGNLKSLHDVLWEWIAVLKRGAHAWDWKDCAWWYTEQALVSTLAAAVWRSGGLALEEYSSVKGRDGRPRQGRCDLYAHVGSQKFVIEAKHCWSSASCRAREIASVLATRLDGARDDARENAAEPGDRRLAALFAIPTIPLSELDATWSLLKDWSSEFASIPALARAWWLPRNGKRLQDRKGRYLYPGVGLLLHSARRRTGA